MVPTMRSRNGANQYTRLLCCVAGDTCRLYEVPVGPFRPLLTDWKCMGVVRITKVEREEGTTCALIHYVDVNGREDTTLSWYAHFLRAHASSQRGQGHNRPTSETLRTAVVSK